jgi:hypothetical protein
MQKNCRVVSRMFLSGMLALAFGSTVKAAELYSSRICVERPGENGRVNITPVTIELPSMGELTIFGENEVCVGANRTQSFQQSVRLKFPYPYSGVSEKLRWWETRPVVVDIQEGKTTHLLLCERDQNHDDPRWEKTGWHDMWMLLPPQKKNLCAR